MMLSLPTLAFRSKVFTTTGELFAKDVAIPRSVFTVLLEVEVFRFVPIKFITFGIKVRTLPLAFLVVQINVVVRAWLLIILLRL